MNMNSQANYSKYHYSQQIPNLDNHRERLCRCPKTINIGESAKETEYNIKNMKSINKMLSPRTLERNKEKENKQKK